MSNLSFSKNERLSSRKLIEQLFNEGKSVSRQPLRAVYDFTEIDTKVPAQFGVAVPKKNLAKASDRNTVKRRIREAYRKNKAEFYQMLKDAKKQCAVMVVYNSKQVLPYNEIEPKIILTLKAISEKIV